MILVKYTTQWGRLSVTKKVSRQLAYIDYFQNIDFFDEGWRFNTRWFLKRNEMYETPKAIRAYAQALVECGYRSILK